MRFKIVILFSLLCFSLAGLHAQKGKKSDLIEVTGFVLVDKGADATNEYIPFATVTVEHRTTGTYADHKGMYSLVIKKGETLVFSALGFESVFITIPKETKGMYKTLLVSLEPRAIEIPEVKVFPWPDRDNLRAEFLAMDPTRAMELGKLAKENLEQNHLMAMAAAATMDSRENATHHMRVQSRNFSYAGQVKPMGIMDPTVWSRFFKSLKKKKTQEEEEKENYKF